MIYFTDQQTNLGQDLYQDDRIEIQIAPECGGGSMTVYDHVPFMLQSVRLVDDAEVFNRLAERHRLRLARVNTTRESAPERVRAFLHLHLRDADGNERNLWCGRGALEDIQAFLQAAVDQGIVPIPEGKGYPDGDDLRVWLRKYEVGIDCSGFVEQVLRRLIVVGHVQLGYVSYSQTEHSIPFLRCGWVDRELTNNLENREQNHQQHGRLATEFL